MTLSETIRERVILLGGKVAGVDCPKCAFKSRDITVEVHTTASITCPNCDTTILTESQKSQLRQAGKL